jgi:osmotically inducible protein OsmC
MATTRTANAHWEGSLLEGGGKVSLDSSGLATFEVTWASRAETLNGRVVGGSSAARSSCFSMALAHAARGPPPVDRHGADVTFQPGRASPAPHRAVSVPGISTEDFDRSRERGPGASEPGTDRYDDHARRRPRLIGPGSALAVGAGRADLAGPEKLQVSGLAYPRNT